MLTFETGGAVASVGDHIASDVTGAAVKTRVAEVAGLLELAHISVVEFRARARVAVVCVDVFVTGAAVLARSSVTYILATTDEIVAVGSIVERVGTAPADVVST